MSYSLKLLKGYIGDYLRVIIGDARSLDHSSVAMNQLQICRPSFSEGAQHAVPSSFEIWNKPDTPKP